MSISQHLLRKLQETLGADAADDLVSWMDNTDANRGDVGELRHEMQLGFARIDARFDKLESTWDGRFGKLESTWDGRFGKLEGRVDALDAKWDGRFDALDAKWDGRFASGEARMDGLFSRMEALVERSLRKQTQFFFLAWAVLLAAIIGIYAR